MLCIIFFTVYKSKRTNFFIFPWLVVLVAIYFMINVENLPSLYFASVANSFLYFQLIFYILRKVICEISFYLRLVLWDVMLYSLVLCSVKGILLLFPLASCTLHFQYLIFPLASHANHHFQGLLFALVLYPPNFKAHCSPWMSCVYFRASADWPVLPAMFSAQWLVLLLTCLQVLLSIGLPCHPFWGLEAHIGLSGLPFPLFIHQYDW